MPGHPGPRPDELSALLITGGVGGLTLALVRGGDWGWASLRTIGMLAAAAAVLGLFALRSARHHNPLVEPALFRVRTFTGASLATLLYSIGFGAMLLAIVLWMQDGWGWSALRTGLAVAPGPIMVPVFSFLVTGRLLARFGPAIVVAAGCVVFTGGILWWAQVVQLRPDYLAILPGMVITGIGVGLTLPSLMSTAAASLPPPSFATGSAVVNMLRQVGLAVGVAMLVAALGKPHGAAAELTAFRHGWYATAATGVAAALSAVVLRRRPAQGRRASTSAATCSPDLTAPSM